jgi:hypothetical protein
MAADKKMKNPVAKLIHFEKDELEVFENSLPRNVSLAEALRAYIKEDNRKNEKPSQGFSASAINPTNINCSKYIMVMDSGIPQLYDDIKTWQTWAMSLDLEQARNFYGRIKELKYIASTAEMNQNAKRKNENWKQDLIQDIQKSINSKSKNRYDGLHIQTPSDVTTAFDPTQEEIVQEEEKL